MKKIISLIASLGLSVTSSTTLVVSCGDDTSDSSVESIILGEIDLYNNKCSSKEIETAVIEIYNKTLKDNSDIGDHIDDTLSVNSNTAIIITKNNNEVNVIFSIVTPTPEITFEKDKLDDAYKTSFINGLKTKNNDIYGDVVSYLGDIEGDNGLTINSLVVYDVNGDFDYKGYQVANDTISSRELIMNLGTSEGVYYVLLSKNVKNYEGNYVIDRGTEFYSIKVTVTAS